MYPFERAMGVMKRMVKSRSRPEGNIVETYVAEEIIEFVSDYLEGVHPVGLPRSRHEGRLQGVGTIGAKPIFAKYDLRQKAHNKVLQSSSVVAPFIAEHKAELRLQNPTKDEQWIKNEHELEFAAWLERRVISSDIGVSETVRSLAGRPDAKVYTFQGYDMNGFTWYTKKQDNKSTNQNSGVTLMAMSANDNLLDSYYGWVEEIWELDYLSFRVAVFKCEWINNEKKGAITRDKDGLGFIIVDPNEIGFRHDPFILASQAKQVFYIEDPANQEKLVVLPGKRRIVGVGSVVDEEEYDQVDEIPAFSTGIEPVPIEDNENETIYWRTDHQEGILEDTPTKKKTKRKSK